MIYIVLCANMAIVALFGKIYLNWANLWKIMQDYSILAVFTTALLLRGYLWAIINY